MGAGLPGYGHMRQTEYSRKETMNVRKNGV